MPTSALDTNRNPPRYKTAPSRAPDGRRPFTPDARTLGGTLEIEDHWQNTFKKAYNAKAWVRLKQHVTTACEASWLVTTLLYANALPLNSQKSLNISPSNTVGVDR